MTDQNSKLTNPSVTSEIIASEPNDNNDYLSKCALCLKHVDNVSALTPEVT
jgi:hypothetical protein